MGPLDTEQIVEGMRGQVEAGIKARQIRDEAKLKELMEKSRHHCQN